MQRDSADLLETIVVALGANLSGPWASPSQALESALSQLMDFEIKVLSVSSLWRSIAWPDPKQPEYINAVAVVETTLGPRETLLALHRLEARFGRTRTGLNAPRVLDLDLIAYGRHVLAEEGFVLPHPRAAERLFVMGPLAELAPDWTHPITGLTAAALAAQATVGRDARPVTAAESAPG